MDAAGRRGALRDLERRRSRGGHRHRLPLARHVRDRRGGGARDEDAGDAQGGEAAAERCREREPRTRERGEEAAPAGGPEGVGLLGREPEVARPGRGGGRRQGGRDGAQVVVQGGAVVARGDEVAGLLEVGALGVTRGERGDQEQVVVAVVGQVRHQSPSPRNRPIEPSSRSRSASRPRWIRDFTVPSDTPVSSAISA